LMLMSVVTELGGTSEMIHPTLSEGTVTEVEFTSYTPAATRLPAGTRRPDWAPDHQMQVRYLQSGDRLLREARYPDGVVERQTLGQGVSGFSATRTGPKTTEPRTSFAESKLVKTITVEAFLWTE